MRRARNCLVLVIDRPGAVVSNGCIARAKALAAVHVMADVRGLGGRIEPWAAPPASVRPSTVLNLEVSMHPELAGV